MEKSITLFIGALTLSVTAMAQDTLRAWNLFHANDIIVYGNRVQSLAPNVIPGNGGLGQTWTFTTTTFDYLDTMNIVEMQDVPAQYTAMFPQANLAIYRGSNQSSFDFIHTDGGTMMNMLGTAALDPNFGVQTAVYDNPLEYLHWPMYYGVTFADTSMMDRKYPTTGQSDSAWDVNMISMNVQVDGQGTLITSYGSYGVIRVRRDFTYWSQHATHDPNTGWTNFSSTNSTARMYEWWTDSIHIGWLVASMLMNPTNGNVLNYRIQSNYVVNVPEYASDYAVTLYPNPANDVMTITGEVNARWEIRNMEGRVVSTGVLRNETEQIDIASLAAGVYVMQVTNTNGTSGHRKFVRQKS